MNSKKIFMRILPVVIALVLIIGIAVILGSCSGDKDAPKISNPSDSYLTVKLDDGKEIVIKNDKIYQDLKSQSGMSVLVELMDVELLKEAADADGVVYWEKITSEEVKDAIKTAIFGENFDELEVDEIVETLTAWYDTMYVTYGIKVSKEDVKYEDGELTITPSERLDRHYRLTLARRAYATDRFTEDEIEAFKEYVEAYQEYVEELKKYENDEITKAPTVPSDASTVKETNVFSKYEEDNEDAYWTLFVTYPTREAADTALVQVGVKIVSRVWYELAFAADGTLEEDDYYSENGRALDKYEIMLKLIQLYNNAHLKDVAGYPNTGNVTNNLTLKENVHYELKVITKAEYDALTEVEKQLYCGDKSTGYDEEANTYEQYHAVIFNVTPTYTEEVDDYGNKVLDEEDTKNLLLYTTSRLEDVDSDLSSNLVSYIKGLQAANAAQSDWSKTYSTAVATSGSVYVLAVKLQVVEATDAEDALGYLYDEDLGDTVNNYTELYNKILADLRKDAVTTTIINQYMAELRNDNDLIIYDYDIETSYIGTYTSDYKQTKKEDAKVVAAVKGHKFTADQLFAELSSRYGTLTAIDSYQYEYILYSEYNEILDYAKYKKGSDPEDCILAADPEEVAKAEADEDYEYSTPKERWAEIEEMVQNTKDAFSGGSYETYGYPASYGWRNFLKSFYQSYYGIRINNVTELKMFYLYQDAVSVMSEAIAETTEEVFTNVYLPYMYRDYARYFSVDGVHLLISVNDDEGNKLPVNVEADELEWTDLQVEYAKELYAKVSELVKKSSPSRISTYLQELDDAFTDVPTFTAYVEQTQNAQNEHLKDEGLYDATYDEYLVEYTVTIKGVTFDLAKYKTANLDIQYESLGTITQGQMVEDFENAVKGMWDHVSENSSFLDQGEADEQVLVYGSDYAQGEYLSTEFGYHVFVATKFNSRTTVTVDGDVKLVTIPTNLEYILGYEEDGSDYELPEDATITIRELEAQISNYYTAINDKYTGSYYYQVIMMNITKDLLDDMTFASGVTKEDVNVILDYYIDSYYSQLSDYIKDDYENALELLKSATYALTYNYELQTTICAAADAAYAKVDLASLTANELEELTEAKAKYDALK